MKTGIGLVTVMALALTAAVPAMAQNLTGGNFAVMPDHSVSTSRLIGELVYDGKGKVIGSVVDVVVAGKGAEPGVILSVGEFVGVGKKLVSVPLSHISLETVQATMGATKQQLVAMPAWLTSP
jgi:sporulation protein YlmC with PRC-barrel domain